jgi:hypothetical protein
VLEKIIKGNMPITPNLKQCIPYTLIKPSKARFN